VNDDGQRSGIIAGLSAYLLWGALTLYWKLLTDFAPFELVGWRVVSASLVMIGVVSISRRWSRLIDVARQPRLVGRIAVAAALLATNWSAYVWAVVNDHVLETALGYFIAPLLTIALGVVVFHERLTRLQRAAVSLALLSVVVLTVSYGRVPVVALLLAGSWSLYGWMKRQVPLTPVESMSAESFVVLLPALAVAVVAGGRTGSIPSTASPVELILVLLTGVATVVPLMLFAWAAQRVPFTLLGPMQYLIPTINFFLGWLLFGEELPLSRVAGFALVWVGLALITVDMVRRQRAATEPDRAAVPSAGGR
jgi:chloramphenicol-sensitive protein RarD